MNKLIDLRSDTVTKPSAAMRQVIAAAEVGDDVFGEDPTVNALEEYAAQLLDKEAALFVATGTQGNLLSVLSHCGRGDEYIAGQLSHVYRWEAGGSCVLGGVYPQPLDFEADGTLNLQLVEKFIKPNDAHFAKTKLLILENTQGGKVLPLTYLKEAAAFAKTHALKTHLDGARVFNASVALNIPIHEIAQYFDSVTFCLSKGLGAPVGSIICASKEFIAQARRQRKMIGGAMRQAGILAAAGLYVLKQNVERLAEDHDNAAYLAEQLTSIPSLQEKVQVFTNMVFVEVGDMSKDKLVTHLKQQGVLIFAGTTLRLVTHLDVNRQDMETVANAFRAFYA